MFFGKKNTDIRYIYSSIESLYTLSAYSKLPQHTYLVHYYSIRFCHLFYFSTHDKDEDSRLSGSNEQRVNQT